MINEYYTLHNQLKVPKMGLEYLDMMIIHSPQPWADFGGDEHYFAGNLQAWKALEDAYQSGKVRAIGVSNFKQKDLENIIDYGNIKPMVNQVLAHISNVPKNLIEYVQSKGILVEAYSPVGHGAVIKQDKVKAIADKYDVSVPQLCIKYDLQLGLLPLPKSTNPDHMKSNAELDFEISEEDMNTLSQMEKVEDYGDDRDMPVFTDKNKQN